MSRKRSLKGLEFDEFIIKQTFQFEIKLKNNSIEEKPAFDNQTFLYRMIMMYIM